MRLVGSSIPGAVDRDTALRLLAERAVLTRAICCELRDENPNHSGRRSRSALAHLCEWIQTNLPESQKQGLDAHAADGLDQMIVPDGCQAIFQEIHAGAQVADALAMSWTADNSRELDDDLQRIRKCLTTYWSEHPAPIAVEWS